MSFPYSNINKHTETVLWLFQSKITCILALKKARSFRNRISPSMSVELYSQQLRNWKLLSPNDSVAQRREVLQDFMNNNKKPIKSF